MGVTVIFIRVFPPTVLKKTLSILLAVAMLCCFATTSNAQVSSDFATNADGWTTPNDADGTIAYSATGGNPNGFVFGTPFSFNLGAGTVYVPYTFDAPAKFTGNKSAYLNGTLRFDLQSSTTGASAQRAEVVITNVAGSGIYYFPTTPFQPPSAPAWQTFSVSLSATTGFWKTTNSATGTAATQADILNVISSINTLSVRGLHRDANITSRLDNVTLMPPIVVTTQPTSTSVCLGNNATMTVAATGNAAITYQWQFESPATVWNDLTNTGGYSGVTTNTITINTTGNFGAGNYRVKVSGTAADDVFTNSATVAIIPLPTAPTTTGNSACGSASLSLSASGGTAGQYRWYTVASGGTAIVGQTAATYTTPLLAITTTFYVAINNGTCESNRTPVTATINTIPSAPGATGASACGPSSVTLTATGAAASQYRWYNVPTGGTAIAGETNATYVTPVIGGTTTYYVSINNGFCEGARTAVIATINTLPTAPGATGASACGSSALTLTASGGSAGQYRWYTVPTGGTAIAGETNATYVTPVITLTTTYYVAINNGTCESTRTAVVGTINTIPTAPGVTGNASCGSAALALTASGGSAGQYRWYTVPTGGTAIVGETNATYTTPLLTLTTTYYVSINNGLCESTRTAVTATINTIPTAPTTTGASACGSSALTLTAAGGTAGQYRWYTVPTGGTAIVGETNATYLTPVLTLTTTYYVSINNGVCESTRTSVIATINTIPAAPGVTGNASCGSAALTLTATGGSPGQYRWYTVPTGGTAIGGQTNATYTTPLLTLTTTYYVAINNGFCEGTRTSVTATINPVPVAPTTTGSSSCGPASLSLTASGGSAGQYRWYTVPTGGTAIAGETNATYVTPVLTLTTTYYVAINNGLCEGTRTAVVATINIIPTAPTTAGASACGASALTLSASGGTAGQYRWYTVPTGGTAIAGETNATYVTPVITLTTTYYVSINNGTCESTRTAVVGTINTIPAAPGATGNASCGSAALALTATGGLAGQYRWYTVATGGTAIAGETNATYTTPVITFTTTFYVSINNGLCEGARTAVVATINTVPIAPTTTGASACGSSALTLSAAGGSAGQYRWYSVSTGGTAIAGQTNSTYTTPLLALTTTFYVSINTGICESVRTAVIGTINTIPTAPGTTGNASCGAAALVLTATGGSAGQYRWYTVATGGTAIGGQTNATFTTPVNTITTTYYVAINNGLCESSRTAVTATINTIPTAPTTTGASACGSSVLTLSAAGGSAGQYRWYSVPTGGTAIVGQTNSNYTTPLLTTSTTFYVSLNNGLCEGARTAVVGTINTIPVAPTTTGANSCGPSTLTLSASGGTAGQYRWYTVASGGTAISGETNATYVTPVLTTSATFYVAINNGSCEGSRASVTATVNTVPATPGTLGAASCTPAALVLTATGAGAGQYRWYTTSTGGTPLVGETSGAFTTPVVTSNTTYYVSIDNGLCESPRVPVVATINNSPPAPATAGVSSCGPGSVVLTASGGSIGQYRWYSTATGGPAIPGEVGPTYTTPVLTTTTTYYVSINFGACEGPRTAAVAGINSIPNTPTTTDGTSCTPAPVTLTATGAANGQYRWYTTSTGGPPIAGETNSTYVTPSLSSTTMYYVSIDNGTCESSRVAVIAYVAPASCSNHPPVIAQTNAVIQIGGKVTLSLLDKISDADDNLDLSTLKIVSPPSSGATASIDANSNLIIDYGNVAFSGKEKVTIRVCDIFAACIDQEITIDVIGEVEVYDAISPNNDGKNDTFIIDYIQNLPGTQQNHVYIFNRWGDLVWEGVNYDNNTVVFSGLNRHGHELPSGVYFYKVEFPGGAKTLKGHITMKR